MGNSVKQELEGKYVLLKAELLKPEYRSDDKRLVLVTGGFGCSPETRGSALIVTFVTDGERTKFDGYDVDRVVSNEEAETIMGGPFEIPEWNSPIPFFG